MNNVFGEFMLTVGDENLSAGISQVPSSPGVALVVNAPHRNRREAR